MFARFTGLLIVVAVLLTACGGGAVLNARNDGIQAESEFCGVNVKFADIPRSATRKEIEEFNEGLGNFEKVDTTALILDKYKLTEAVVCICREITNNKFLINPSGSEIKQRNIDNFGMATFFERIESSIKMRYQYIVPSGDSLCHVLQFDKTLVNSNRGSIFFDSITAIKSKTNSPVKTTPKDRLIQLEALKKDGLITQSDYEIKKKTILDSL